MSDMRLKQVRAGASKRLVAGTLTLVFLAAAGCVKNVPDVPKPPANSMMATMEADPIARVRELQKESADFANLVHTLPGATRQDDRGTIRQAFGDLTQLLPLVQVGPKGGVFGHQVSVVADTQTLLSGEATNLSTAPTIDRGLRAVYNALDDAQHNGSEYYQDAALRATLDQLSAKINEFDTARGALHDIAWADALSLTSDAVSRMTGILADRLAIGATTVPATGASEPAPATEPAVTPAATGPAAAPPAAPTTAPAEPGAAPMTAPTTGPTEPATVPPAAVPATAPAGSGTAAPTTPATEPAGPPPATGPTSGPAAGNGPPADEAMAAVHENLAKLIEALGGLSKDELDKETALENAILDEIKADPAILRSPSFLGDVLKRYRDILTAEHQTKFDSLMAASAVRTAGILTSNHLRQIGLASLMYANDHANQFPPDLGTLVSPSLGPEIFLLARSKTSVPPDFATGDAKTQAAWVNQNTDFVYLGAGKLSSALIVLAYPKTGGDTGYFLLSDGSVQTFNAGQSAKIIAELQAGTNPPASLTK